MKAIILAAGRGTRMQSFTRNIPKPLLQVGAKTILQYKVDSLRQAGFQDSDIVVVIGYLAEKIRNKFPTLTLIENPQYDTKNNLYSLWLAREYTKNNFILMNADTIHCKEIFAKAFSSDHESFVMVDSQIKEPQDLSVVIDNLGKVLLVDFKLNPEKIFGKSVQFTKFSRQDAAVFMCYIEDCFSREEFQRGANIMSSELLSKMNLMVIDIGGLPWAEIDTPEDLEAAQKLIENEHF